MYALYVTYLGDRSMENEEHTVYTQFVSSFLQNGMSYNIVRVIRLENKVRVKTLIDNLFTLIIVGSWLNLIPDSTTSWTTFSSCTASKQSSH